jgi:hypothetical protein
VKRFFVASNQSFGILEKLTLADQTANCKHGYLTCRRSAAIIGNTDEKKDQ